MPAPRRPAVFTPAPPPTRPTPTASPTYRFYSVGIDGNGNTEATPNSSGGLTVTATFQPAPLQVTHLAIQHGELERSYERYVTVNFNQIGTTLQTLIANQRVKLIAYGLDGSGGTP